MYFDSLSSLVDMNGHGIYVWSAYGVGLLVILYNILVPLLRNRQLIRSIQRQYRHKTITTSVQSQSVSPVQTAGNNRKSGNATDRGDSI